MKIVICGGHFSPAFSVIKHLKNDQIVYAGRRYALEGDDVESFEYRTIKSLNIPFVEIKTGRFQRRLTRFSIPSLLKTPYGLGQSIAFLKKFKPDIVVGFGGYISAPVILSAAMLKIPVVIHEQTLEAGFANRFLSRFAKKICISWTSSQPYFPKSKTVVTGIPIRNEVTSGKNTNLFKFKEKLPLIYITGGSLGSRRINKIIFESLDKLNREANLIIQTGGASESTDFNLLTKLASRLDNKQRIIIKEFLSPLESAEALRKADLVVSRSGINTVSELLFLKKPSLLLPLPLSQRSEQVKNAFFLKRKGLAEVIMDKDLNYELFLETVGKMLKGKKHYVLSEASSEVNSDSSEKIVKVIKGVLR